MSRLPDETAAPVTIEPVPCIGKQYRAVHTPAYRFPWVIYQHRESIAGRIGQDICDESPDGARDVANVLVHNERG